MAKGHKVSNHGMAPPADSREALQWFVNTYGLYMGSVRGLFLSDWNEEQAVSLEAAVINLRSRGYAPFTVAGETLYQQADFLFQESQNRSSFARPMASKVELELSGNEIVVVDGLEAPEKPHHLWYLWSYLLFPRVISGKVTILTTPLAYQEFIKYGHACPDFDFLGRPINWEKLVWLLECSTINQDLYKLAREESVPPMLKPEYNLYTALKDRNLDPIPQCVLGDYLLDFALIDKEQKLNIECDALSALSGHEIHTKEARRDLVLLSDGWQILKFSSAEILNNRTACSDVIEDIWRGGRKRSHCGRYLSGKSLPQTPELPDDDAQRSAITFGGGPIALVGGAGTGKTACLSQRCAYLLSQGISPENILMISYSADSARMLKQTMAPLVEKPLLQRLNIMSWQDLGMKILKENLPAIKRKPPIKLETSPQKVIQKLLAKIKKEVDATKLEMAGDLDEFYLAAMIGMYKSHLISPKKAKEDAQGDAEEIIARIYQSYEDQLQKANRIDKHDVTALSVQVLLENAETRLKYQTQYEFILVDEYQDVTVAQDIFIRLLAAPQDNLFIAGDEDETISENRNSCPELLADFTLRFPHGRCVVLEQNWRSHPALVDYTRLLISHLDRSKIRKEYVSAWGQSPGMAVFGPQICADEAEESKWVAAQVKALLDAGRNARDIAILYRQNKYESIIEDELDALNVRFRASHSDSSMIPDEVGDMLAFLKLVMDPDGPKAREAFERVCQLGTKEIDPKLSATISSFASANSLSYLKAVEIYAEATADQSCRELEQLVRIIRAMNQDRLPPAESIGYLRRTRRLNDYYKGIKIPPGQSYEPLKKLTQLEEDARKFTSVSEFIKHAEEKQGEEDDSGDDQTVHIKSVFDVKGFEFPIVFIVGLAQGLFPVDNADDLEEERRQFYVAFTRAREAIYLSAPARFAEKDRVPSLFLIEMQLVAMSAFELAQASAAAAAQAEILAQQQQNIKHLPPQTVPPAAVMPPAAHPEPPQPQIAYVEPQGAPVAPAAPVQQVQQEPVPPPVQTHIHMPITAEMQGVAAGSAYDQEEIRKGLSPFVDNPEPILSRGMDYLPPSKGVSQEPNSSPPPQGSQPNPQAQNQSPVPYPPKPPQPPQMPAMPASAVKQGPKINSTSPPQPDPVASPAVEKSQAAASLSQNAQPREPVAPAVSRANKITSELPPLSQPAPPVVVQADNGPPLTNTPNPSLAGNSAGSTERTSPQIVSGNNQNSQQAYQPPQSSVPAPGHTQQGAYPSPHQTQSQQAPLPQSPPQLTQQTSPLSQQQAIRPQQQLPQQGPATQMPPQQAYVDPYSASQSYVSPQSSHAAAQPQSPVAGACPSCQMPLEPGARFCGECGYSIPAEPPQAMPPSNYPETYDVSLENAYVEMLVCGVCANVLEPGAKFCGECGTPYQAPQDLPPNAQRVPDGKGGWMVKFLKFLEE